MVNNRFSKLAQDFLTSYIVSECNHFMNTKAYYATTFHLVLEFMSEEKVLN